MVCLTFRTRNMKLSGIWLYVESLTHPGQSLSTRAIKTTSLNIQKFTAMKREIGYPMSNVFQVRFKLKHSSQFY